ncbi:phosphatidylserine/phosphatidylglycerophosphate/cardiolipin synthase family protein [Halomonas sp. McH1-25]|uniref:phospholipase D-like domain-containing protein n=1 Tax=unclassified Halomonas TaxID=2609666 RepID=UPI001EF41C6D|nr:MULTISPECIES: phosphatidylserine/phosphatidylglycerophosphate/cardiolipin synthase family protein [unclassified Halomonas]MCG7599325.1 phosphatidylserine/phosphatidylglycerophosphate/cardiolipin synthase family protein [Halomonas sp. McH1-25]MCP1341193.1 phosphatidylserine/phosphatidylglycerophosphate/cardiolipin synthase family protein [Halomonas sp. FL8]MCP1362099.1 phosphatidylserine/phosphatidylglycerophosphate/cardiolipin synthase family protein [Halomonas sp. BBD45]MCP1364494.1 phospha
MTRSVWRSGNQFTLLPEGKRYIPEILAAIDDANETILFEQYLAESGHLADRVIDALVRAANRGVHVQVLFDGYGAKGLKQRDRARLTQSGAALRFFNPFSTGRLSHKLTRDHRKLVLVDGRVAFTGGFCLTDDFLDKWYDIALRIEGPVVSDWSALFTKLWDSPSTQGKDSLPSLEDVMLTESAEPREQGMRGRLIWGHGRRDQAIRYSLQQRISAATQRVWVYTPYFLPTLSLRRRLMAAARRGVDVRLLVAGKKHDHPSVRYTGQHYYGRLLRAGVRVYEYQPSFTHAKFCLIDDWSTIGSCNFDHWSLRWNLEANQEVEDGRFAADVAALFEDNLEVSQEICPASWRQRPWRRRARERALGTVNSWATLLR